MGGAAARRRRPVVTGTKKAMADVSKASLAIADDALETPGPRTSPTSTPRRSLRALTAQATPRVRHHRKILEALNGILDGSDSKLFRSSSSPSWCCRSSLRCDLARRGPFTRRLSPPCGALAAEELLRLIVRWLTGPLLARSRSSRRWWSSSSAAAEFFAAQADLLRQQQPRDDHEDPRRRAAASARLPARCVPRGVRGAAR